MEAFCNEVVTEIKRAESEVELISVIGNSLSRLRKERNSFNERGYIVNMIVSLQAMDTQYVSVEALDNVRLAIAIFRQLQKEIRERIF